MARGGPPKEMKTLRSRCGVRASALPPSFRSARSFTSEPVAPAILSPVLVPTASSTERILQYLRKCSSDSGAATGWHCSSTARTKACKKNFCPAIIGKGAAQRPAGGGTVSTAGNLVFRVIPDGRLVAYRADTGEKLMEIKTGLRGGMGPPVTWELDGKQYVTLTGGTGPFKPSVGAAAPPTGTPALPKMLTFVLDRTAQLPEVKQ
jgi:hypothetical protein